MHKLSLAVVFTLTACSSNICTMDVASMSLESVTGEVDLIGTFDEAQPILILTGSGAPVQVVCSLRSGSTIAAICDLKAAAVPAGNYAATFDMTCHDTSAKKDALAVGAGVPAMLKVN